MSTNINYADGYEPNAQTIQFAMKVAEQRTREAKIPAVMPSFENVNMWVKKVDRLFEDMGALHLLINTWTPVTISQLGEFLSLAEAAGIDTSEFRDLRHRAKMALSTPGMASALKTPEYVFTPMRARPRAQQSAATAATSSSATPSKAGKASGSAAPPRTVQLTELQKEESAKLIDKFNTKAQEAQHQSAGAVYAPPYKLMTAHDAIKAGTTSPFGSDTYVSTQLRLIKKLSEQTIWVFATSATAPSGRKACSRGS